MQKITSTLLQKKLTKDEEKKKNALRDRIIIRVEEATNIFNQIKLFLNIKEAAHSDFIESADLFINNAFDKALMTEIVTSVSEAELIEKAQVVLKNAWEQAKKEK